MFKVGDQVKCSALARARGIYRQRQNREGTIKSLSMLPDCVIVIWDGRKTPDRINIKFLDHVTPPK